MNCLSLIQQKYPFMSPVEKRIADCILSDPGEAVNATIVYIATKARVSEGSVINFASSLGFRGFSQMKIQLAQSLVAFQTEEPIEEEGKPRKIMRRLMEQATHSFKSTLDAMGDEITEAAELLIKADKIYVVGLANSQFVASDLAFRLMRIGLPVQAFSDPLIAGVACSQMTGKSVLLAVSNFGRTKDVLACARMAKEAGAHLVCLTSNAYSPLAQESEVSLVAVSMEAQAYRESMTARLTQLLISDCLVQYVEEQIGNEAVVRLDKMVEIYEQYREAPEMT